MLMPIFFDDIIRSPAISFNRLIRCNILGDNLLNSFLVHGFYDSHPGKTHSIFICGGFDNHRGLLGPSSPFVSTGTAAKERCCRSCPDESSFDKKTIHRADHPGCCTDIRRSYAGERIMSSKKHSNLIKSSFPQTSVAGQRDAQMGPYLGQSEDGPKAFLLSGS